MRLRRGNTFPAARQAKDAEKKRKRPDSVKSHRTLVEQPSPEVCSRTTLRSDRRGGNGTNGRLLWINPGRPGRNRTCNRRIRNPMLYPFELRAQIVYFTIVYFTKDRK